MALAARMADMDPPDAVTMHPKAIESYLGKIERLAETITAGRNAEAIAIVRELVDHITVFPREKNEPVTFEVAGTLAALLDPSVGSVVPRGGIEPPTLRFSVACSTN